MFSAALILLLAAGSCVNSIDLIQPDTMVVQPGQSLSITCQVSGYSLTDNSYATGWIRQCEGKPMEWILHRYGGGDIYQNNALKNKFLHYTLTSTSSVKLTGLNMQPEDTAVYYCVRDSGGRVAAFDYWGKGTMVTVTSANPTAPTVFPLMPCGSGTGDLVTLGCLATGFTPSSLTYTWSKNGAALTDFIQYPPVQKGNVYTGVSQIRVRRQDWDARQTFKCAVTHPAGNAEATVVPPPPVICKLPTLVLASSEKENEVTFSCLAKDFSPKDYEFKWLKNEEDIPNKIYEIKTCDGKEVTETKVYSAASFLAVPSSEWTEDSKFTCVFEGKCKGQITFVNSSVTKDTTPPEQCEGQVDIKITGPKLEDIFSNRKGTLECHVTANKPSVEKIFWEDHNGKEMADASMTPPKGSVGPFTLPLEISYDEWSKGVKRVCIVEHTEVIDPVKQLYQRRNGGQTQRPSVFMLPPVEHTRKEMVTLTCYVKDFYPQEVLVSWLVDDEEADSKYKFYTTNPVENNGSYSAYGQLSLSLEQWKKNDVVYSCVVYHESLVNTTKAIVRSIGQRTFEKTNLVNLNMNIPETCKA
nr:immunoglobulin M heavy chain [Lateolabrax japonicus]